MPEGGRRWRRTAVAVVVGLSLSWAAVGCSSGSSSTTPATLSGHDAYFHDASAVCRQMQDQAAALNQTAATVSDASHLGELLDQNVAILQSAVTQLKALTPDPADAAEVTAYLGDLDDLLAQSSALVTAMKSGDDSASALSRTRQTQAQKKANDAAAALGLGDCVIT